MVKVTESAPSTAVTSGQRTSGLRIAVLAVSVLQAASPAVFGLTGSSALDENGGGEPAIVPAGYAFAIWGAVCIAGVVYGMWQLPRGRGADEVKDALAVPMIIASTGFVLWLAAAASPLTAVTVPIFLIMLAALVVALRRLQRDPGSGSLSRGARALSAVTVGLYAGWTSAAVWVNLATVLADAGLHPEGAFAFVGQAAILAGATATLCAVAWYTGARIPYVAAGAWALVGVVVGTLGAGVPGLAVVAVSGLVALLFVSTARRFRRPA